MLQYQDMFNNGVAFLNSIAEEKVAIVTIEDIAAAKQRWTGGPCYLTENIITEHTKVTPLALCAIFNDIGFKTRLVTLNGDEEDDAVYQTVGKGDEDDIIGLMFGLTDKDLEMCEILLTEFLEDVDDETPGNDN